MPNIRFYRTFILLVLSLVCIHSTGRAQSSEFDEIIEKLDILDGYFPLYIDSESDAVYMSIEKSQGEFLYVTYLSSGVGSNDLGLDRGQIRSTQLVEFQKLGNKLLLVQPNETFIASSTNSSEVRAVREAFAHSVLWGFTIKAEKDGTYLIDASDFLLRPDNSLSRSLNNRKEGSFSVDASRSAIDFSNCKSFPQNTEINVFLTYTGGPAGRYLRSVSPNANAFTVGIRHSFVQLPIEQFEMRPADPRIGYFTLEKYDYAAPYNEPIRKHYVIRHRLEKTDPGAAKSTVKEPIVYYLDSGTPEPVRSALLDGARWWNTAFEEAGFIDAFRVEVMPSDADPLDIRYNVIQWVHRATRGWSYGASVVDPRTGEIIKGHVTLGSLRFRHDYKIAEALLQLYSDPVSDSKVNQAREMAIARLRQLSAHEVGHTLGLLHNFAASSYSDGLGSVMDYPHPMVTFTSDSALSLTNAYPTGVGTWDKFAIKYGYSDFGEKGAELKFLREYTTRNISSNTSYISDSDARAAGGAHPKAHLWDNGTNAAEQLQYVLDVRRKAIEQFSERAIRNGTPMSELESSFAPLYFFHRYQLSACSKLVGGVDYAYKVRGDNSDLVQVVDPGVQREAIEAMIRSVSVPDLTIPPRLSKMIVPPAPYYGGDREGFEGYTDPIFDPIAAAKSAATMSLEALLHPNRAARLIEQHANDSAHLSFIDLLERLHEVAFYEEQKSEMDRTIQRTVAQAYLATMFELIADTQISENVRAQAYYSLQMLAEKLTERSGEINDRAELAHLTFSLKQIELIQTPSEIIGSSSTPDAPPGSPIGSPGHIGCDCYSTRP